MFYIKPPMHYLNTKIRNLVKVLHKDIVLKNGSGVRESGVGGIGVGDTVIGGSGMLDEEEIMKLFEE